MTRAKDHLHLIVPQRFFVHQQRGGAGGDRHLYATCTRFIPATIRKEFDNRAWPLARGPAAAAAAPRTTVDIGARLRRMWR